MPNSEPVRYRPDVETLLDGEEGYDRDLTAVTLKMSHTVQTDTGHVRRSVHAKSHGVLRGELEVLLALPPQYAQGMFAQAARYPALLRLSTTPGDMLPDTVSTPRGMALEVIGVPGARLPGSEADTTQNFVVWEVRAQLCTDLEAMPIEDASVQWPEDRGPEDRSPYVAVARITVPAQDSWSEAMVAAVDEGITFSPWRGLAAHQPLGSVMRTRRRAYESSAAYCRDCTGLGLAEPQSGSELPS